MSVLTATITATHQNFIELTANFVSRENSREIIIVDIEFKKVNNIIHHGDIILDPRNPSHAVNITGEGVSLTGNLKMDFTRRIIVFEGSMVWPGEVQVGFSPIVVAVL